MALSASTLKNSLKSAFLANIPSPTTDQTNHIDTMCGAIANAMVTFVSGATVTYTSGLTSPSGAVAGVSGMTLS
jgi:hypothetical protein